MPKEVDAGQLLALVNEIDSRALAEGAPLFGQAWAVEKRAMWRKGLLVMQFYPELEEQVAAPNKGGRPRKTSALGISFHAVARLLGRSDKAVQNWCKLATAVGRTEAEFKKWLVAAQTPVLESFSLKLLAADTGEAKLDKPLVIKDLDLLQIEERLKGGEATDADVKWLAARVRVLMKVVDKALKYLLDEKSAEAAKVLERGVEGL